MSACTTPQSVLEPTALVSQNTTGAQQFPLTQQPGAQQTTAVQSDARVQFAPVIGATAEASTPLAARLTARANARGINLVGAGGASATHIMRGYFSAISDNGETTVIYVWDVVDPSGNRIHRIQGQAKSSGTGDGWSGVQSATMEAIADQTVDQLASWLVSAQG